MTVTPALALVGHELASARAAHAPMRGAHEAVAVILEEFEEFKAEVFCKRPEQREMARELVQLAAMAVRALEDLGLVEHINDPPRTSEGYAVAGIDPPR